MTCDEVIDTAASAEAAYRMVMNKYTKEDSMKGNFDNSQKKVRTVWDKCVAPPSVKDWKDNAYKIDSAGYVPIDKMIKRMLEDGKRLEEFRMTEDYRQLYNFEEEHNQPFVDELMYQDRAELLITAQELKAELAEIRRNKAKAQPSKVEEPPKVTETPPQKEAVSTSESN